MKTSILFALMIFNSSILSASTNPIEEDKPLEVTQPAPQYPQEADQLRYPISPSPENEEDSDFIDKIGQAISSIFSEIGSNFSGLHLFAWPSFSDDELHESIETSTEPKEASHSEITPEPLPQFTGNLHLILKNLSSNDSCFKIFDQLQGYSITSLNFSGCRLVVLQAFIDYLKKNENSFCNLNLISCVGHKLQPNQIHDLLDTCTKRIKGQMSIDLTPSGDYKNTLILTGLAGRYCIKNASLKIVLTGISLPKNFLHLNLPKGLIVQEYQEDQEDLANRLNLIRKIMRDETITLVDGDGSKLHLE